MSKKKDYVHIRISQELKKRFEAVCERMSVTPSERIRYLVTKDTEENEKRAAE